MVKTIYITRHGFRSNWVLDKPMPPPPTGIPADPVLAEHGLDQAAELAAHLKALADSGSRPVQQIYSSPYYRCLQTATPTSKALGLKVFVDHGASEWLNRQYEISPKPASTKTLVENHFPELIDASYEPILGDSSLNESYDKLLQRAKFFINSLVERLDKTQPEIENILIVTHAATKIALGRAILGDDHLDIRTGTCSLDTFVRDPEDPTKWTAEKIGDTSFLTDGEEMHWSFENVFAPGSTEDIKARMMASDAPIANEKDISNGTSQKEEEMVDIFVTLDLSQVYESVINELGSVSLARLMRQKPAETNNIINNNEEEEEEEDDEEEDEEDDDNDDASDEDEGEEEELKVELHASKTPGEKIQLNSEEAIAAFISQHSRLRQERRRRLKKRGLAIDDDDADGHLGKTPSRMRRFRATGRGQADSKIVEDSSLQIVDLGSDQPLIRVGNELYVGVWEDLVGTEIYANSEGEVLGTSRTRIRLVPAKVKLRSLHPDEHNRDLSGLIFGDKETDDGSALQSSNKDEGQSHENEPAKDTQEIQKNQEDNIQVEKEVITIDEDESKENPLQFALENDADGDVEITDSTPSKSKAKESSPIVSPPPFTPDAKKETQSKEPMNLMARLRAINLERIKKEGSPQMSERRKKELESATKVDESGEDNLSAQVELQPDSQFKEKGIVKQIHSEEHEEKSGEAAKNGLENRSNDEETNETNEKDKETNNNGEEDVEMLDA